MDRAPSIERFGDLVDDGVDVVSGELRPAERGVECFAGVFPLVPLRFVVR